jgi:mxaJ protein
MCSASSLLFLAAGAGLSFATLQAAELRVCADPNNLPFSNRQQQGFDNQIAKLVAADLGKGVTYVWAPERGESFVRKTLLAKRCDVVMGIPSAYPDALASEPYYRSTYVFLWRRDRNLQVRSLNDPALHGLRIGVHIVSDDASNLPPAQALAKRGLFRNMVSYSIYGDLSKPNPPAALIDAVARGSVDLAIAWGPLAGFFAQRAGTPIAIIPVSPQVDRPFLPFTFSISIGVRPMDKELLKSIDRALEHHRNEIHRILRSYGVPLLDADLRAGSRP